MTKISTLPADDTPTGDDYTVTVDTGSGQTKKVLLSDLFTYMLGAFNASSGINSGAIDWSGGDIWYQEIARTTLTSAGDTISVTNIPARKYLKVLIYTMPTGGTTVHRLRFNNDSGTTYADRADVDGAADTTSTNDNWHTPISDVSAFPAWGVLEIVNVATQNKLTVGHSVRATNASDAGAPGKRITTHLWNNTSDQINRIDIINATGTGDFAIGSEIVVLGHD